MRVRRQTAGLITVAMAALIAGGCGGGGGSQAAGGGGGGGGAGAAAVSQGVITAKGSITVNGVKFDTAGAVIRVDDNPNGTDNDLKVGMVVKVKGTFDDRTGTATEIEFEDNIQGVIENVDPVAKTITIMGQTVRVEDNLTRFTDDTAKTLAASGLQAGDVVEVSGFPDDKGGLRATRIEDRTLADEFEIKGFVSNLDADSFTLKVTPTATDSFTVNYTVLPAGVQNNSYVEVKTTVPVVGGVINASVVELEDAKIGVANQKAEVEGLVTSGTSASFVINGVTVQTTVSTKYENGVAGDVLPNVHLEAEGKLNGAGVLVATKISFRNNLRIQGLVTAKAGAGQNGTLTLLGLTVTTSDTTEFRPDNNLPVTLADIVPNTTRVEIRGFIGQDGVLIANRVEITNDTKEIVQGPVSAVDSVAGGATIAGLVITTDGSTEYRNAADAALTKGQFFALVTAGPAPVPFTVVKVRLNTGTLVADQMEIEGTR